MVPDSHVPMLIFTALFLFGTGAGLIFTLVRLSRNMP